MRSRREGWTDPMRPHQQTVGGTLTFTLSDMGSS